MMTTLPLTRDLVLIGGGHTHALVLRMWAMDPLPGARLTVIDPGPRVAYSGMLPGFVAGHYTRDDLDIDLIRLARIAGARVIPARATGIDLTARTVTIDGRGPIAFDVASLDIGIHSQMEDLPGFADHAVAAKPLGPFAARWDAFRKGGGGPMAVLGAGIAGVELAMAMAHALPGAPVHLIDRSTALAGMPPRARDRLLRELAVQGVTLIENAGVTEVSADHVALADGRQIPALFVTGAAGARPYDWLAQTGLDLHKGHVTVGATLQTSDPAIFAAGDCAHLSHAPRPKAGVYAVRAAPVLLHNLRAALGAGTLRRWTPQRDYLKLVSLGGKRALAEKGGHVLAGPLLWRWKDRIDRTFMRKFTDQEPMAPPALPRLRAAGVDDALGDKPMCGGCGAKVGKDALTDALATLPAPARADVTPLPGDDAALLTTGGARQVLTTDHLRAVVEDPALMARIAATHALGDIWAMGAAPQAAVAQIILPRMAEPLQRRTMEEVLTAAHDVLRAAGADLVGGHSSMGSELTIGFSITGLCESAPITLRGARPGDALLLTKPIGSGTVLAADMAALANGDDVTACWALMEQGQADASRILSGAHAMTDVTGFGLAGHLWGICRASGVAARLDSQAIPLMPGAEALTAAGVRSTIWTDNRAAVPVFDGPDSPRTTLLFDPQTAGGMLAAVPGADADTLLARLRAAGLPAARIGDITDGPAAITVD